MRRTCFTWYGLANKPMVRLAVHNRLKLLVAVLRSHYASEFAERPCHFAAVQVQLVRALQVHPEISGHAKITG
jgi:hypothetical protein